jgi:pilus assembly protein CpaB
MKSKSLYLLVACICGSVAAVFASQWLNAQAGTGKGNTAEIFVASVDISVGDEITAERIRLEEWPIDKVPQGASGDLATLEAKYAKQRVYAGEPIVPVKLMDVNWTAVPKGYQTVGLSSAGINIARVIQPGDRVDVTAYFTKSDLIPRDIVRQVLMGVRVYSLDGDTERRAGEDRPKSVRSIELMIHKNDMEAWTWANELGKIRLSLGSDGDYGTEDGSNEAGKEFLAWLEVHRERQELSDAPAKTDTRSTALVSEQVKDKVKEEGHIMLMMSEGKMKKFLLVPGELPRLLGEVGGESSEQEELGEERDYEISGEADEEDEHSYLNGKESPFYQPPVDRVPG